jgi:hypothetical protein
MEAIKKKMQAMKVEKDNACDRYTPKKDILIVLVAKGDT